MYPAPRQPEELPKNLDALVYGLVGNWRRARWQRRRLQANAQAVMAEKETLREWRQGRFREFVKSCRANVLRNRQSSSRATRIPALAAICEASRREMGLDPYPVQVMAACGLLEGYMVEMATGEGKTLAAGLAGALVGWTRRPFHVVTANDYLAARDAQWLEPLYQSLRISSGAVVSGMPPAERRRTYRHDICYGTSKELAADFLRDRLARGRIQDPERRQLIALLHGAGRERGQQVMRGIHTVFIDEADSVLIDEAVTPLIISRQVQKPILQEAFQVAVEVAENLEPLRHYKTNPKYQEIDFTPAGERTVLSSKNRFPAAWQGESRCLELVHQVLMAGEYYHRGTQYLVADGRVVIIDQFTGRPMPHRTWRDGLHQAIKIREGLEMTHPTETLARLSFQRFFRQFHHIAGMTGTAREAAEEFWQIYGLPVVRIPLNRPSRRQSLPVRLYATLEEKRQAVAREIVEVSRSGRPVLVGLRDVRESELLSELLQKLKCDHEVLNATHHREEAGIIARAGQPGRVTLATNMAGRGTDIRLGPGVAEQGGLHVIATEMQDSSRVDRQLIGRCARQGEPGSFRFFLSLEDPLLQRFAPDASRRPGTGELQHQVGLLLPIYERAQKVAENLAFKQRKSVLRSDQWLEESLGFAGSLR